MNFVTITKLGRALLLSAVMVVGAAFVPSVFAQEAQPTSAVGQPKIAVYVTGDAPEDKKRIIGTRLLVALVKTGRYDSIDRNAEFAEAADKERAAQKSAVTVESSVYSVAATFGAGYVCMADVSVIADEYQIFARVVDVKTARGVAIGDFYGPITTAADFKPALDELVGTMFPKAKKTAPVVAPQAQVPATTAAPTATPTAALTAAVSLVGEAKAVVDKVVAAVNAFKDATNKSVEAANAVKTATQSKNFSAIMDAKKKVTAAADAVKAAKADVETAIEALKAAGPEAEAAVKAMGIDLAMFGGKGDGGEQGEGAEGKEVWGKEIVQRVDYAMKYIFPLKTPISSWGGVDMEMEIVRSSWGVIYGVDIFFSADSGGPLIGYGINVGKGYDLGNQMQIVYGGSLDAWMVGKKIFGKGDDMSMYSLLAPRVKYRWRFLEVSAAWLFGVRAHSFEEEYDNGWGTSLTKHESEGGFYHSPQIMAGFYIKGPTFAVRKKIKD